MFYARREKETTMKRDEDRTKFIDKIRNGFHQNQEVTDYYNTLYQDLAVKEKQFEEQIIDIPARQKYLRDLETERQKQQLKKEQNDMTNNYIKHQIDDRHHMKKDFVTRDTQETRYLTDKAVDRVDN